MPHLIFVGRKSVTQWDNPPDKINHRNSRISLYWYGYFWLQLGEIVKPFMSIFNRIDLRESKVLGSLII